MDVSSSKRRTIVHCRGEINALHAPSADRHDAKELVTRYNNCRNISTSSQTSRIARNSDKTGSFVGYA